MSASDSTLELVIDSFAGGGGASEGIRAAIGRDPDIAINHDRMALAMHRMNHPGTHHIAENVVLLDPRRMVGHRPIGMLWMSPDCKDHSKAKGGKPLDKNIRGLAWTVVGWMKKLPKRQRARVVFFENVEEFADWGPLRADGTRCPLQKGAIFRQFVAAWRALGYDAEFRELRACDYGVPTIRKRLYGIIRRDGEPIVWPEPTHGDPRSEAVRSGRLKSWVAAASIIDWSLVCPSIFDSSLAIKLKYGIRAIRPLADATMARIAKGTMRYVVNAAKPFVVQVNHGGGAGGRAHAVDEPAPTFTGGRGEALVTPFVSFAQQGGRNRDAADPLHTVTASRKDQDTIVTPFVTKFNTGSVGRGMDEPLHTITSHASDTHGGGAAPLGIVAPILVGCGGRAGQSEPRSGDAPLCTQTAKPDLCVVAPFLAPRYQEKAGQEPRVRSAEDPAATIIGGDNVPGHLVTPFLVPRYGERPHRFRCESCGEAFTDPHATGVSGLAPAECPRCGEEGRIVELPGQEPRTRSLEEPAPVVVPTGNEGSLAAVHLSRQFGASVGSGADEPIGTITAGGAGKAAVVAAFLAQHNTERDGGIKAGSDIREPVRTVTGSGGQQTVVSAFLAQHNTDMVGHTATEPVSTIVGKGCTQGLVAAHLTHAFTSNTRGGEGDLEKPIKTVLAGGQHAALVSAFLAKYHGTGEPVQAADEPLHTVTAKPRHGLVTVTIAGEPFVIVDIGMRMLTPRERFSAQGFRRDYVIDRGLEADGSIVPFTLEQQGRFCGNSVCPRMAEVLVAANYRPRRSAGRPAPTAAPLFNLEAAE